MSSHNDYVIQGRADYPSVQSFSPSATAENEQLPASPAQNKDCESNLDGLSLSPGIVGHKADAAGDEHVSLRPAAIEIHGIYKPLRAGEIRVLVVEGFEPIRRPDSRHDLTDLAIRCHLKISKHEATRAGRSQYVALSYVWGSPSRNRYVLCDGELVPVTSNLFNALWHITVDAEELPFRMWADALCINQADSREKSQQVAVMNKIYQNAKYVIAWLGSEAEYSSRELDEFWVWVVALQQYDRDMLSPPSKAVFEAADEFLKHCVWFKRVWTFQEIVLAKRALLKIGHHTVDWDTITSIADLYGIQGLRDMYEQVHQAKTVPDRLLPLLIANADRIASDPRDCIFALLGIYTGGGDLVADYDATPEEVNARVAAVVAHEEGNLKFLDLSVLPANLTKEVSERPPKHVQDPFYMTIRLVGGKYTSSWIPDFIRADGKTLSSLLVDERQDLRFLCKEFTMGMRLREGRVLNLNAILLGCWVLNESIGPDGLKRSNLRPSPACVSDASRSRDERYLRRENDPHEPLFSFGGSAGLDPGRRNPYHVFYDLFQHDAERCTCRQSSKSFVTSLRMLSSMSSSSRQKASNRRSSRETGEQNEDPPASLGQIWCCLLLGSLVPYLVAVRRVANKRRIKCSLFGKLHESDDWSKHIAGLSKGSFPKPVPESWASPEDVSAGSGIAMSWIRVELDIFPG